MKGVIRNAAVDIRVNPRAKIPAGGLRQDAAADTTRLVWLPASP
jgi:hypothetical protein